MPDKLCPGRKRVYYEHYRGGNMESCEQHEAQVATEEFLSCLGEQCAWWIMWGTARGRCAICDLAESQQAIAGNRRCS